MAIGKQLTVDNVLSGWKVRRLLPAAFACLLIGCTAPKEHSEDPSPAKTPEEELKTFQLDSGLTIQLVASEPMIQDPVVITFDEDGRLWVVEMRGFMPDIEGAGEDQRVGRVSVLEDTDSDGMMDKSTVYLDSLIMPRALAIVPGGALVAENQSLWLTQDTNGDLKADTKTLVDPQYTGGPLVEHSGNGLWRGMDNWYYNAKSRFRYKLVNNSWLRDSTEFRGQWGICHDDKGRLYYNYNWSQLHADLVPPNYLSRNKNHRPTSGIDVGLTLDRRVYPARPNPAVNRGYIPGTLDEKGRLREFTAACAPLYYRATTLPQTYYGNAFVCEPSGNLVKRDVVKETEGVLLSAYDPHPGREFLASTDERFRPVFLASGPDGALYIADMYRGLVQHGKYVTPYLRDQTLKRKLVKPINRGRIWRIVPDGWTPVPAKKLSALSSSELIHVLSSPNGWDRDMAQRLLVERKDVGIRKALEEVVLAGGNSPGRIHALWALEGLNMLSADFLFKVAEDKYIPLSNTSFRLLESFSRTNKVVRAKLAAVFHRLSGMAPMERILQMTLTAGVLDEFDSHRLLVEILERYDTSRLVRDAIVSSIQNREFTFLNTLSKSVWWEQYSASREIFLEMITTSIVKKKNTSELSKLLAMADVNPLSWREKTMLTGMAIQGGNGKWKAVQLVSAPGILMQPSGRIDTSRLVVLSSMFDWPGHKASAVAVAINPLSPGDREQFALGRQQYLSTCAACHGTDGAGLNRFGPPLIGSEWVTGDEKRLALIVLHGIEGPLDVAGKHYDEPEILPVMPPHSTMEDASITAILTYIRNEWGNHAGAMNKRTVGSTRHTTQGRVMPWTAEELNKHMATKEDQE